MPYFEVYCECGYGLCDATTVKGQKFYVEVCPRCKGELMDKIAELELKIENDEE